MAAAWKRRDSEQSGRPGSRDASASVLMAAGKFKGLAKSNMTQKEKAQEFISEQVGSQSSCRALPFTILFYASFSLALIVHRDVGTVFPLLDSLGSSLNTGVVPRAMPESDLATKPTDLTDVRSWADALVWLERTMVPLFWAGGNGGAGAVLGVNRLVGGARIRQRRLKRVDCPGPETLANSYSAWFDATYGQSCVSLDSEYSSETRTSGVLSSLSQGTTPNSEGWYTYWVDADLEQPEALARVALLRTTGWLDTETDSLQLQSIVYNGQVAVFVIVEVEIFMDRVGAFTKGLKTKSLPAKVYTSSWAYVADFAFFALLLWLGIGETIALCVAIKRDGSRGLRMHLLQFERVTNAFLLFVGVGFIIFFCVMSVNLADISDSFAQVIITSDDQEGTSVERFRELLDESYDRASDMAEQTRYQEFMAFAYTCVMMFKFFDGFRGNQRLAILTDTLVVAADDLFHFFWIFIVVFSNFILGAYLLFGQALKEWSSIRRAANTGFRALMGDFDFEAMYIIAPISATFWFWTYMLLIFLILINILLAIVLEAYERVKEEAGNNSESLLSMCRRWATLSRSRITGHTVTEIEKPVFAARTVGNEQISQEIASFRQEMRTAVKNLQETSRSGSLETYRGEDHAGGAKINGLSGATETTSGSPFGNVVSGASRGLPPREKSNAHTPELHKPRPGDVPQGDRLRNLTAAPGSDEADMVDVDEDKLKQLLKPPGTTSWPKSQQCMVESS